MAAGIIEGYGVRVNRSAIGHQVHVKISLRVDRQNVTLSSQLAQRFAEMDEVTACEKITGRDDYLLDCFLQDIPSLSIFLDERILALDGVLDASTSIVLDRMPTRVRYAQPTSNS